MKVLLFTGAGASAELGVPTMRVIAQDLHRHFASQKLPETVLHRFNTMLTDHDYDIEKLIEIVDGISNGSEQQTKLGIAVDVELQSAVRIMRQEAEWYIQHVCERVRDIDAQVLWSAALRKTDGHEICFATTNYDRSIEIGGRFSEVSIDDGFAVFDGREIAHWRGIDAGSALQLVKIHGSTDWYRGSDEHVYKLRHPMPLYGNLAVMEDEGDGPKMTSALVLPAREKRVNFPPYPDLVATFRNAAKKADVAIFIGTSLRDPDIRDICRQCAERIPTYFVSRDGAPRGVTVSTQLKVVVQTASKFIASTLPRFLSTSRTDDLDAAAMSESGEQVSVLPWLIAIHDTNRPVEEICGAIEKLADNDIAVDIATLSPLLRRTNDAVSSYAVALLDKSLDRTEAMQLAGQLAATETNGVFTREWVMLKELLGEEKMQKQTEVPTNTG